MQYIDQTLSYDEIIKFQKQYGSYVKVTVDIENERLVMGCELHADGEKILLEKGSEQQNIWGGGINFDTKDVDALAVLNLRPRLNNNSMEILDSERRKKFIETVKKLFSALWES